MKTAPELEDPLSDLTLLIDQQRYDEALSILSDLMKKNPADREIWMYRLLIKRILTLQHSLSLRNTRSGEYFRAMATVLARGGSAVRILELRKLRRTFVRYRDLARTWLGNRDSHLQSGLAELRKELNQLRNQNHELMSEINSLASKLAPREGIIAEIQTIKRRTESNTQQLHAMNRQLQQEIAAIRDQIQTSGTRVSESASQNHDGADRNATQIDISELKKGLEENEANFRAYLEANFRALDVMQQELGTVRSQERIFTEQQYELKTQMAELQRELSAHATPPSSVDSTAAFRVSNQKEMKPAVWSSRKARWRLGIMPATGVIAATAAVGIAFLSTSSDKLPGSKQPAVELRPISSEQSTPPPAGFEPSKPIPQAPRVRGTFQTIHQTEVFNGPSENAALIGSIRAGMRIRVVDSRDGWLEILTKQGRRGAFLRQEAAVRIDQN